MKQTESKKHTQLPNGMSEIKYIKPKDQLIYVVIRSHMNKDTYSCFPSLETISSESKLSIPSVRNSIKVLEKFNFFQVKKEGRKNVYYFNKEKLDGFEPFSDKFIKEINLTPTSKAYIVAAQQYMYKDEEGIGKLSYSNRKMAELINMSETSVRRCNSELERKNYLVTVNNNSLDMETGLQSKTRIYDLNRLGQDIIWVLRNHEERISENTKDIKELKEAFYGKMKDDEEKIKSLETTNRKLLEKIAELEKDKQEEKKIIMT